MSGSLGDWISDFVVPVCTSSAYTSFQKEEDIFNESFYVLQFDYQEYDEVFQTNLFVAKTLDDMLIHLKSHYFLIESESWHKDWTEREIALEDLKFNNETFIDKCTKTTHQKDICYLWIDRKNRQHSNIDSRYSGYSIQKVTQSR